MFNRLKKLFFVEEETTELEVEMPQVTTTQIVQQEIEPQPEETMIIQDLKTVEKPITITITSDVKTKIEERRATTVQTNYEFETILSPFSGKSTKPTSTKPTTKTKKATVDTSSATVISPMFGATNRVHEEVVEDIVENELTLDEIITNDDNEQELIQFTLFEEDKK